MKSSSLPPSPSVTQSGRGRGPLKRGVCRYSDAKEDLSSTTLSTPSDPKYGGDLTSPREGTTGAAGVTSLASSSGGSKPTKEDCVAAHGASPVGGGFPREGCGPYHSPSEGSQSASAPSGTPPSFPPTVSTAYLFQVESNALPSATEGSPLVKSQTPPRRVVEASCHEQHSRTLSRDDRTSSSVVSGVGSPPSHSSTTAPACGSVSGVRPHSPGDLYSECPTTATSPRFPSRRTSLAPSTVAETPVAAAKMPRADHSRCAADTSLPGHSPVACLQVKVPPEGAEGSGAGETSASKALQLSRPPPPPALSEFLLQQRDGRQRDGAKTAAPRQGTSPALSASANESSRSQGLRPEDGVASPLFSGGCSPAAMETARPPTVKAPASPTCGSGTSADPIRRTIPGLLTWDEGASGSPTATATRSSRVSGAARVSSFTDPALRPSYPTSPSRRVRAMTGVVFPPASPGGPGSPPLSQWPSQVNSPLHRSGTVGVASDTRARREWPATSGFNARSPMAGSPRAMPSDVPHGSDSRVLWPSHAVGSPTRVSVLSGRSLITSFEDATGSPTSVRGRRRSSPVLPSDAFRAGATTPSTGQGGQAAQGVSPHAPLPTPLQDRLAQKQEPTGSTPASSRNGDVDRPTSWFGYDSFALPPHSGRHEASLPQPQHHTSNKGSFPAGGSPHPGLDAFASIEELSVSRSQRAAGSISRAVHPGDWLESRSQSGGLDCRASPGSNSFGHGAASGSGCSGAFVSNRSMSMVGVFALPKLNAAAFDSLSHESGIGAGNGSARDADTLSPSCRVETDRSCHVDAQQSSSGLADAIATALGCENGVTRRRAEAGQRGGEAPAVGGTVPRRPLCPVGRPLTLVSDTGSENEDSASEASSDTGLAQSIPTISFSRGLSFAQDSRQGSWFPRSVMVPLHMKESVDERSGAQKEDCHPETPKRRKESLRGAELSDSRVDVDSEHRRKRHHRKSKRGRRVKTSSEEALAAGDIGSNPSARMLFSTFASGKDQDDSVVTADTHADLDVTCGPPRSAEDGDNTLRQQIGVCGSSRSASASTGLRGSPVPTTVQHPSALPDPYDTAKGPRGGRGLDSSVGKTLQQVCEGARPPGILADHKGDEQHSPPTPFIKSRLRSARNTDSVTVNRAPTPDGTRAVTISAEVFQVAATSASQSTGTASMSSSTTSQHSGTSATSSGEEALRRVGRFPEKARPRRRKPSAFAGSSGVTKGVADRREERDREDEDDGEDEWIIKRPLRSVARGDRGHHSRHRERPTVSLGIFDSDVDMEENEVSDDLEGVFGKGSSPTAVDSDDLFGLRTPLSPCPSSTAPHFDVVARMSPQSVATAHRRKLKERVLTTTGSTASPRGGPSASKSCSNLSSASRSSTLGSAAPQGVAHPVKHQPAATTVPRASSDAASRTNLGSTFSHLPMALRSDPQRPSRGLRIDVLSVEREGEGRPRDSATSAGIVSGDSFVSPHSDLCGGDGALCHSDRVLSSEPLQHSCSPFSPPLMSPEEFPSGGRHSTVSLAGQPPNMADPLRRDANPVECAPNADDNTGRCLPVSEPPPLTSHDNGDPALTPARCLSPAMTSTPPGGRLTPQYHTRVTQSNPSSLPHAESLSMASFASTSGHGRTAAPRSSSIAPGASTAEAFRHSRGAAETSALASQDEPLRDTVESPALTAIVPTAANSTSHERVMVSAIASVNTASVSGGCDVSGDGEIGASFFSGAMTAPHHDGQLPHLPSVVPCSLAKDAELVYACSSDASPHGATQRREVSFPLQLGAQRGEGSNASSTTSRTGTAFATSCTMNSREGASSVRAASAGQDLPSAESLQETSACAADEAVCVPAHHRGILPCPLEERVGTSSLDTGDVSRVPASLTRAAAADSLYTSYEARSSILCDSVAAPSPTTVFQQALPIRSFHGCTSLRGSRSHQEDNFVALPDIVIDVSPEAVLAGSPARLAESGLGAASITSMNPSPARATETSATTATRVVDGSHHQRAASASPETRRLSCFGVFDGHNGDEVSHMASQFFLEHLTLAYQHHYGEYTAAMGAASTADDGNGRDSSIADTEADDRDDQRVLSKALVQSLLHLDVTIHDALQTKHKCDAGSTACVAAFYLPEPKRRPNARKSCLVQGRFRSPHASPSVPGEPALGAGAHPTPASESGLPAQQTDATTLLYGEEPNPSLRRRSRSTGASDVCEGGVAEQAEHCATLDASLVSVISQRRSSSVTGTPRTRLVPLVSDKSGVSFCVHRSPHPIRQPPPQNEVPSQRSSVGSHTPSLGVGRTPQRTVRKGLTGYADTPPFGFAGPATEHLPGRDGTRAEGNESVLLCLDVLPPLPASTAALSVEARCGTSGETQPTVYRSPSARNLFGSPARSSLGAEGDAPHSPHSSRERSRNSETRDDSATAQDRDLMSEAYGHTEDNGNHPTGDEEEQEVVQEDEEEEGLDYVKLCIANLGDSRAVVGNACTGELVLETRDHRIPRHPAERDRILAAGGSVDFDRVDGCLDVTRGLGDYRYKQEPETWWYQHQASSPSPSGSHGGDRPQVAGEGGVPDEAPRSEMNRSQETRTANVVSNLAEVYEWQMRPYDFLVMASDGVWDRMSSQQAVAFVARDLCRLLEPGRTTAAAASSGWYTTPFTLNKGHRPPPVVPSRVFGSQHDPSNFSTAHGEGGTMPSMPIGIVSASASLCTPARSSAAQPPWKNAGLDASDSHAHPDDALAAPATSHMPSVAISATASNDVPCQRTTERPLRASHPAGLLSDAGCTTGPRKGHVLVSDKASSAFRSIFATPPTADAATNTQAVTANAPPEQKDHPTLHSCRPDLMDSKDRDAPRRGASQLGGGAQAHVGKDSEAPDVDGKERATTVSLGLTESGRGTQATTSVPLSMNRNVSESIMEESKHTPPPAPEYRGATDVIQEDEERISSLNAAYEALDESPSPKLPVPCTTSVNMTPSASLFSLHSQHSPSPSRGHLSAHIRPAPSVTEVPPSYPEADIQDKANTPAQYKNAIDAATRQPEQASARSHGVQRGEERLDETNRIHRSETPPWLHASHGNVSQKSAEYGSTGSFPSLDTRHAASLAGALQAAALHGENPLPCINMQHPFGKCSLHDADMFSTPIRLDSYAPPRALREHTPNNEGSFPSLTAHGNAATNTGFMSFMSTPAASHPGWAGQSVGGIFSASAHPLSSHTTFMSKTQGGRAPSVDSGASGEMPLQHVAQQAANNLAKHALYELSSSDNVTVIVVLFACGGQAREGRVEDTPCRTDGVSSAATSTPFVAAERHYSSFMRTPVQ